MYHIAILTSSQKKGKELQKWTAEYSELYGIFPNVEIYETANSFFEKMPQKRTEGVILDIPGVEGLNTAVHLRTVSPDCEMIWCSDLDFSLQAYRLRKAYFMMYPIIREQIETGLSCWYEKKGYHLKTSKRKANI